MLAVMKAKNSSKQTANIPIALSAENLYSKNIAENLPSTTKHPARIVAATVKRVADVIKEVL